MSIKDELNKRVPSEHLETRQQGGANLTYVTGHYVLRRLSEVYGGFWSYRITELKEVQAEQKNDKWWVGYTCIIYLYVPNGCDEEFPASTSTCKHVEDIGFGQGIDRDLGKAHESAVKEAVTDGIKRCAKSLGDTFGLHLYDKSDGRKREQDAKQETAVKDVKTQAQMAWKKMGGNRETWEQGENLVGKTKMPQLVLAADGITAEQFLKEAT